MASSEADAQRVISACLESGSQQAWTGFVRLFQPLIASVILRMVRNNGDMSSATADDLIQETYLRLCRDNCKALREFKHRHEHAIFGFIKVVAGSVALDYIRARNAEKRLAESRVEKDDALEAVADPGVDIHGSVQIGEISTLLDRIAQNERDRTIFWLYYQQGYTARDIANIPGINLSPKGVESSILRLTKAIRTLMNPSLFRARSEGVFTPPSVGEMR